ncbi:MAG: hypothetical protein FWJ64_01240 [Limnochordia bacterium]|nr:hypothetical protein [Bacillota bacterium]
MAFSRGLEDALRSLDEAAGLLEAAAGRLRDAAEQLRRAAGDGPGGGGPGAPDALPGGCRGAASGEDPAAYVARHLAARWSREARDPIFTAGGVEIDLTTAHGKWQLLMLAVLKGARVREAVVYRTFAGLVERGLDRLEKLAADSAFTREELEEVLARRYRALTRREAKVEALVENAARLLREYGGDLDRLYAAAGGDSQALVRALQEFKQMGVTAHWLCRVLKHHGIWPGAGPEATRYFDRYTELPLQRLGLVAGGAGGGRGGGAAKFVDAYLGGDTLPLYRHGLFLCSRDDAALCRAECPFHRLCTFPARTE